MDKRTRQLVEVINKRIKHREATLATIQNPLDSVPDEVKKMREAEAGRLRAVIEEQKDIIEIINMLEVK